MRRHGCRRPSCRALSDHVAYTSRLAIGKFGCERERLDGLHLSLIADTVLPMSSFKTCATVTQSVVRLLHTRHTVRPPDSRDPAHSRTYRTYTPRTETHKPQPHKDQGKSRTQYTPGYSTQLYALFTRLYFTRYETFSRTSRAPLALPLRFISHVGS